VQFLAVKIEILQGDITTVRADAIVNAANSSLMGGGGVDGAIHRAAGPSLLSQCVAVREQSGPCPTGQVVATGAGNLQAKYVLHAVGPIWTDGSQDEDRLLKDCYRHALALAAKLDCLTVAFPAISTGIFGFPMDRAVRCVAEVMEDAEFDPALRGIETVSFVLRGQEQINLYREHFDIRIDAVPAASSQAHAFLAGTGVDGRGRTIEVVLGFTNQELERVHDYIQWLFPLAEPSRFNPEAPLLDASSIDAIKNDPVAVVNLQRALDRMLSFYEVSDHWAVPYDHNVLRITRILRSSRTLLGFGAASVALERINIRCDKLGFDPEEETLGYWRRAAMR